MQRFITLFLTAVFLGFTASAQQTEPQDSLVQALREVVVTAKPPAAKLVGSSLVSTIASSSLRNANDRSGSSRIRMSCQYPEVRTASQAPANKHKKMTKKLSPTTIRNYTLCRGNDTINVNLPLIPGELLPS